MRIRYVYNLFSHHLACEFIICVVDGGPPKSSDQLSVRFPAQDANEDDLKNPIVKPSIS